MADNFCRVILTVVYLRLTQLLSGFWVRFTLMVSKCSPENVFQTDSTVNVFQTVSPVAVFLTGSPVAVFQTVL